MTVHESPSPKRRRLFARSAFFVALVGFAAPVLALGIPATLRIPIVKPHGPSDPPQASLFSHWSHNQYDCSTCHPAIFPKALVGFTHDHMDAGKFCGTCHDSKTAFGLDDDGVKCSSCHKR